jgi:hypothetical protein
MDAKISKWANNVLPTVATVGVAAVALVTVVIVSAHVGISDELRAQLIAGTGLALLLLLLFATGPMRYKATGDVPAEPATTAPLFKQGARLTADQFSGLTTPVQKSLVEKQRGMSFRALYVGLDGRWSTSKVQSLMWTMIFVYALATIFIADEIGLTFDEGKTFGTMAFSANYLLLLGGPYAALVAAKGITSSQPDRKTTDDTSPSDKTVAQGLHEVVGDDDGNTDLGDFQFFLFNLVAAVVFLVSFVPDVQAGLPVLPDYLVALTGASALTYVGKKAFGTQTPSITAIVPGRVRPGGTLTIRGIGLTAGTRVPVVTVDGLAADDVTITRAPRTAVDEVQLAAKVPLRLAAGAGKSVSVQPTGGVAAATGTIEVIDTALTSDPDPVVWAPLAALTLNGSDLVTVEAGNVVVKIGDETVLTVVEVTPTKIRATLPEVLDPAVPPAPRLSLNVTLADGTERAGGSIAVVVPQMVVTSVAPAPVVVTAGAAMTITGTGFGPQPAAQVDGTVELGGQRVIWTAWTDTSVVASLPAANTPEFNALTALNGTSVPLKVQRTGRANGSLAVQL